MSLGCVGLVNSWLDGKKQILWLGHDAESLKMPHMYSLAWQKIYFHYGMRVYVI
jgi:hypothetical protein